jgi:HJR/Mrr/RecB family endonuclease
MIGGIMGIIKFGPKTKSNEIVIDAKLVDVEFDSPTLPKGYGWNGILTEADLNDNFRRLSWENAEDLVGTLFSKKGYDSTVTQRSGDFGIDVEARTDREFIGIQVKHWNGTVDFDTVAKTLGVQNKYNRVIIVSTKAGFSSHALTWANRDENRYRIELWDTNRFKNELRQYVLRQ